MRPVVTLDEAGRAWTVSVDRLPPSGARGAPPASAGGVFRTQAGHLEGVADLGVARRRGDLFRPDLHLSAGDLYAASTHPAHHAVMVGGLGLRPPDVTGATQPVSGFPVTAMDDVDAAESASRPRCR